MKIICARFASKSGAKVGALSRDKIDLARVIHDNEPVLRWGFTPTPAWVRFINDAEPISLAANKSMSRTVLDKAGVAVPKIIDLYKDNEVRLPIIGRPEKHHGAVGFHKIETLHQLVYAYNRGCRYFAELIDKQEEYRVHVVSNRILFVQNKNIAFGQEVGNMDNVKWSVIKRSEWDKDLCKIGLDAVRALGLLFGAVDVLKSTEGKYMALEVNTAPGLCNYSAWKYLQWIDWLKDNVDDCYFHDRNPERASGYAFLVKP